MYEGMLDIELVRMGKDLLRRLPEVERAKCEQGTLVLLEEAYIMRRRDLLMGAIQHLAGIARLCVKINQVQARGLN